MKNQNLFSLITTSLSLLLFCVVVDLKAQSPQGIPYQAVVRNVDGSVMSNASVNMNFKIHDGTASGSVVYEESHALTSNAQGLVTCVVGDGVVSQSNFGNIQWGSGAKFLHVEMNIGNGEMDLGTQQMMSVPYALYSTIASNGISGVSNYRDTLYMANGDHIVIPNVSVSNGPQSKTGMALLQGVNTCESEVISVSGCVGETAIEYSENHMLWAS